MRSRIVKELRQVALWPVAATAVLFTAGPYLGRARGLELAPILYLLVAVFIPAARVFGAEFDFKTIDRLLSQPVERRRLWREKMFVLAVTTGLAFAALQLARPLFFDSGGAGAGVDLVLCLVAFGGGPLLSLYFRQTFLAFFASITLPGIAIWMWLLPIYLVRGDIHVGAFWVHIPPALLYVPVAYILARRLFWSLELAEGASPKLSLPGWFRVPAASTLGPTSRLVLKELQIQTPNLLLVPATLVLWSIIYAVARHATDVAWLGPAAVFAATATALLTLIFPLMLGATAVAAERQIGLSDWHASLPVSRRRQWSIKVFVVTSLALAGSVLAGFLDRPLVALLEARRIAMLPLDEWTTGVWVLAAAAGMYASSRSREPLRAIVGAMALLIVALIPATSPLALEVKGAGLGSALFPGVPAAGLYLGVLLPSLALVVFAFQSFRPEPWHWDEREAYAMRSLVVAGLLLSIGFW